ncbi:hypothetical protein LMG31506_03032 [Cupriavidus yeoncheonensis]|uniref:Uncharacterized protein n=1 Tax=Cupriavidus yeoncheonensis TaxID=1462994 RepID=A0A916N460_9BURK|nr:hypothetical protein [Cupriavidus yeoncheonensis]CAG2144557.1 hypothetical protein LMG31506_03032 [Cupriavidus yeoncheonensis]
MKLFGLKEPVEVATNELREARLQLLQAAAALEHYQHTVAMLNQRIKRLDHVVNGVAIAALPDVGDF